ncbi:NUDIX hydrolase [Pseudonocardia acaciae]|uniref:NUDIX hydrolase n=1 Tax=Pseudonocardia acaciae TaxID=551276 RepID=UPI00316ACFF5
MVLDVHILLVRDGQILLSRRRGGYGDGMWHLPSGKTDMGEPADRAVVREAHEEVGVIIDPDDLRFVHALHVQHPDEEPRLGVFFEATRWRGEPTNREPDKCSAVRWFPLTALPDWTIPYPAAGISAYLAGVPFGVFGWGNEIPRYYNGAPRPEPARILPADLGSPR